MYGASDCPHCGKPYRYVINCAPDVLRCDDCGFKEPVSSDNYEYSDRDPITSARKRQQVLTRTGLGLRKEARRQSFRPKYYGDPKYIPRDLLFQDSTPK
jgi:hypothetical protein